MKQLAMTFLVVFVASLASSLSAAILYNVFWAGNEHVAIICEQGDPPSDPPVKLNW